MKTIRICCGTGCLANGSAKVAEEFDAVMEFQDPHAVGFAVFHASLIEIPVPVGNRTEGNLTVILKRAVNLCIFLLNQEFTVFFPIHKCSEIFGAARSNQKAASIRNRAGTLGKKP